MTLLATFKHISSKNADYGAAEAYLTFEHDEFTMKPTLDENGRLIPREDYRISSLNCGGEDFAVACMRANLHYEKNQKREDVKNHHYIISFDPRDGTDNGLTVDQAQELGEKFCKEHFPGHQAIVCTHPDGHNHSGNIHVHIVINSLRIYEVKLCTVIDNILLNEKPADFEAFLQKLEQQGYEIKRGKHTSVKGARQKRFIRFRTLGAGYSEDEIKAVIAGEAEHRPHQKQPPKEKPFHLLVDIQAKLSEGKSESYARWAKRYNLKEMSKTLIFLQENKIGNIEEMQERVNAATARYHELGDSIKAAEQRMAEIAVLRAHIINYAKTRPVYDAYRKAGYSKKFLEEHREQITLHRAAKATFDEAGLKKLPKVKELNTEYSTLLSQKKAAYPAYRKARDEMQELMKAQKNVEIFFAEEKTTKEKAQTR